MGKNKKPKQEVVKYAMSIHFGICAGPVEYLSNILIEEKRAWPRLAPPLWTTQGTYLIDQKDLFGGYKKEGGVEGHITWLPGTSTQVMPEVLAAKHGRTSATMPAYRGIATIFFTGRPGDDMKSFYWRANSPYLPGVWCEVGRASIGLSAGIARIYRSLVSLSQPGVDFGSLGTGNAPSKWDTNGDWCVCGDAKQVFTLPDGEVRTLTGGLTDTGAVHITDDGELFRRTGGDLSGGDPTYFEIRSLDDPDLSISQSINLKAAILGAGGSFDINSGFSMDDVQVGGTRYALAWLAPAIYSGPWMLLSKDAGSAWGIEWAQPISIALPSGHAIETLSMGPQYAYCLATNTAAQIVLVDWAGTFSAAYVTPPSLGARSIRTVHYFEETDEVILVCTNGDILVYNAAFTTLMRSKTGNGAGLGSPDGLLAKRMDLGAGQIALPEAGASGVDWIRIIDVPSLTVVKTITVADTEFVNPEIGYTFAGINRTWGGALMAKHLTGPSSFWFFAPTGKFDSNPAHIIYECLTNTNWGMGAPSSAVDVDAFEAAATVLYGERFGLSMIWTRSGAIEDFISEVLDHIEATLFVNPRTGLLTLKLIRNDYSVPSLPVFTPDNSLVTNFSRKLWGETINEIVVTWTNPDNEEEETVIAQDLANIEAQGGVISDGRNYYGVRRSDLAAFLSQRDLRSASTPLAKCDLEVNRTAWALLPGDCCVLNSPEDGIDSIVMRVGPVDYGKPGDSAVRVSLMEDVFSLALADYSEPPESEWVDTSEPPSPIDHAEIITLPYYMASNLIDASVVAGVDYPEVFAGVLAAEDGQDTDTFELYGQATDAAGGTGYTDFGTRTIASRATLPDALPLEAETTILTFPDRTQGNGPVTGGLMLVQGSDETDSELCLVSDFGVSGYTFKRGVLDTIPRAWPAATPVWFVDASMNFVDDIDIRAEGETVNYKILTNTSQGTLAEALAPVVSETMTARPHLPLRPADVEVNGDDGFAGAVDMTGLDPIPVTWARRNRETETAVIKAWTDGDVTPETGQTTIIEVLDPTGTSVVTTHSGLSGTSYNVPAASFGGATSGWIRVGSERDGLRELQAYAIQCVLPVPVSVPVTGVSLAAAVGGVTVDAGTVPAALVYRGSNAVTSVATHNYTAAPIGTASADRLVIAAISARRSSAAARNILSVTIGGIAATVHITIADTTGSTGSVTAGVASVLVPSGTTADVVVVYDAAPADSNISVYTATGAGIVFDAVIANSNDPSTSTLDVKTGGFIVAAFASNLTTADMTMTGVTEDRDVAGSVGRLGAGSASSLSVQTNRTVAVSSSATFEALAAVSWSASNWTGDTVLDGKSPTGAWSMSRDLITAFAGSTRYTTATGVDSLKDQSGYGRHFNQATAANQPAVTTAGPNSRNCADFDGSNDVLQNTGIVSNFISGTTGYMAVSVMFDAITVSAGSIYQNPAVVGEGGGFMGLLVQNTASTPETIHAYNYDGTQDYASLAAVVINTPYVIEWRHESGNLYIRVNGGSWSSATASGTTTNLASALKLGAGYASSASNVDAKIFELVTFNYIPSTTVQDAIVADFKTHIGA